MEDSLRYVYPVDQFYDECKDEFKLEVLTPSLASPLQITVPDIHRPAFALTGFMEFFLHERIQLIGETETVYLLFARPGPAARGPDEALFEAPLLHHHDERARADAGPRPARDRARHSGDPHGAADDAVSPHARRSSRGRFRAAHVGPRLSRRRVRRRAPLLGTERNRQERDRARPRRAGAPARRRRRRRDHQARAT